MRLIDADALKEDIDNLRLFKKWIREEIKTHIDNAPTVEYPFYQEAYQTGYEEGKNEKPTINCKDCDGYEAGYSAGLKDAERPQGEWLKEPNGKTTDIYRCSVCKRSIMLCKGADLTNYPFCHCGADMRGEEE